MSAPISKQASAVEAMTRVIAGGAQKPSAKERDYLVPLLQDAAITLRWLERHEVKIRARVNAEARP